MLPLAVRLPTIDEGEPPVTRLSVAPDPLSIATLFPLPISKRFQSTTPRVEPGCVIASPFGWAVMVPAPAT